MREHHVARHVSIGIAHGMCVTGTGRGQSLETKSLEVAGTADVPWVGDDKAATLMQRTEGAAFVGGAHDRILDTLRGADNALNLDTIANVPLTRKSCPPERWSGRRHQNPFDIPTLRCDQIGAAYSLRCCVRSLNGCTQRN